MENSSFTPTHIIVLSELHPKEKEKYYDLLIQNDSKFEKKDQDTFIANVRVLGKRLLVMLFYHLNYDC